MQYLHCFDAIGWATRRAIGHPVRRFQNPLVNVSGWGAAQGPRVNEEFRPVL